MKFFTIGIDPGKNGGIVSLTNGRLTTMDAMPSSIEDLWNHFIYLGFPNMIKKENTYVYRELVHSRPTDSRVGAFSFGRHNGHLDIVLNRMDAKVMLVSPQVWMADFKIKKKEKESSYDYKKRLLLLAKRVAKSNRESKADQLTLKTCDAYLLALYGYNQQLVKQKEELNETK